MLLARHAQNCFRFGFKLVGSPYAFLLHVHLGLPSHPNSLILLLGAKYDAATKKGIHVVCPDWVLESVKKQKALEPKLFHPKLLVAAAPASVDGGDSVENGGEKKPPPPTTILKKFKQSQRATEELRAMQAMVGGVSGG